MEALYPVIEKSASKEEQKRKFDAQEASISIIVAKETALNDEERQIFTSLIAKPYFTNEDIPKLEKFAIETLRQRGFKPVMNLHINESDTVGFHLLKHLV